MQLEHLLEKYSFQKRIVRPDILPSVIETGLPEDYITYLRHYHGFDGIIGEQYLSLWDIDTLLENNNGIQEFYPAAIGIGSDGAGELIALEHLSPNVYRVILTPFIGMDCPIEIGESFTDFLARLDKGWSWFE